MIISLDDSSEDVVEEVWATAWVKIVGGAEWDEAVAAMVVEWVVDFVTTSN